MTKYLVFGWSGRASFDTPADELLGTVSEIGLVEEVPNDTKGEDWQPFGWRIVDTEIKLTDNLFKGDSFPMRVFCSYSTEHPESHPMVAYYIIPGT